MNHDLKSIIKRILFRIKGKVVRIKARKPAKGNVLISYTTLPFIFPETINGHTNRWECKYMAESFVKRGYDVDIVDIDNHKFIPSKSYRYCIDAQDNLGRLAPRLNKDCIKIFYINMQHWRANNIAEQARLDDFEKRTGIKPKPERMVTPNESAEYADLLLLLGNTETESTYAHLKKPIYHIPISTICKYPSPEQKDIEKARHSFVWLGGGGPIHKGVDLLIEAFAAMPKYTLHLCGKYQSKEIEHAYRKELRLPNIRSHGVIDLCGMEFAKIAKNSLAVLSASCAEGQSGATIMGMYAGLIPIISKETGIDTNDFGITLENTTIGTIQDAVQSLAQQPAELLHKQTIATWRWVNEHHTREKFAESFDDFVDSLERMK